VRDYLIDEGGINADRIEIKGFGESKPIVPNDSAANKRRNRRVELTIID
jgi:outer membrane protein OmpA-like peptidoglycan-associated protein